jgi:uncharacterized membrane protein YfcA
VSFWIFVALILLVVYLRQLHRQEKTNMSRLRLAKWTFITLTLVDAVLGLFFSVAGAAFRWLILLILFGYARKYFIPSTSATSPRSTI